MQLQAVRNAHVELEFERSSSPIYLGHKAIRSMSQACCRSKRLMLDQKSTKKLSHPIETERVIQYAALEALSSCVWRPISFSVESSAIGEDSRNGLSVELYHHRQGWWSRRIPAIWKLFAAKGFIVHHCALTELSPVERCWRTYQPSINAKRGMQASPWPTEIAARSDRDLFATAKTCI